MIRRALLFTTLAAGLAACGGGGSPTAVGSPVRLQLDGPADARTVKVGHVEVRGSVSPSSAEVRINGKVAEVSAGRFAMDVDLVRGGNVIDVAASRPGRVPAFTTARVTFDDTVEIPLLVGRDPDEVERELEQQGLRVDSTHGGAFYDGLLSGDPEVCTSTPAAGAKVRPGSTVELVWARRCD